MRHKEILRENGLKATHQRLVILEHIDRAGHIELDTLYDVLKESYPTLSLATLYRNLHELKSKAIVDEVNTKNKTVYFETKKNDHSHFVCKECGTIEDIALDSQSLIMQVSVAGYKIDSEAITYYGSCKNCN